MQLLYIKIGNLQSAAMKGSVICVENLRGHKIKARVDVISLLR